MLGIAGGLAVVTAVAFLLLWFHPGESSKSGVSPGGGVTVKVDQKLADQGKQLADSNGCTSCHTIDGAPGLGPTWKGSFGTEVELQSGKKLRVNDAYLQESIDDPGAEVRKGFSPSMPSFKDKLSATDTGALVEYIKSLSG